MASVAEYVIAGALDLAAIDSCKPGIVLWGEEREYMWCDLHPSYTLYYGRERWRLDILKERVLEDVRELLLFYDRIVYYVNVKAYREALDYVASRYRGYLVSGGPSKLSPLSFRSRRERAVLVRTIERLLH